MILKSNERRATRYEKNDEVGTINDEREESLSHHSDFIVHRSHSYPLATHFIISPRLAPLPCMRKPTRKIRPATQTTQSVAVSELAAATASCQTGMPGGMTSRAVA